MLGDINVAEPKALIGFAGPRVIEQTVREKLPQGFQRSEFLLEKGAIDMIVRRPEMRDTLADVLAMLTNKPSFNTTEDTLVVEEEDVKIDIASDDAVIDAPEQVKDSAKHKKMMNNQFTIPNAESPLEAWLSYQTNLHSQNIDMGLERVGLVARKMGLTQPAPRVITVGGTNGKGTTCHTIESILMAAGLKVGVYSSPHLVRYTERVRIQGSNWPSPTFAVPLPRLNKSEAISL